MEANEENEKKNKYKHKLTARNFSRSFLHKHSFKLLFVVVASSSVLLISVVFFLYLFYSWFRFVTFFHTHSTFNAPTEKHIHLVCYRSSNHQHYIIIVSWNIIRKFNHFPSNFVNVKYFFFSDKKLFLFDFFQRTNFGFFNLFIYCFFFLCDFVNLHFYHHFCVEIFSMKEKVSKIISVTFLLFWAREKQSVKKT